MGQIIHDSGVFPQDSVCGFEKDSEMCKNEEKTAAAVESNVVAVLSKI